MLSSINKTLSLLREVKPLVLNLTNVVTMDFIANGLLSLGAAPIMSQSEIEIADLLQLSQVLVINPGTLDEKFISLAQIACRVANQLNVPIVLDPVGVGASCYRSDFSQQLLRDYSIAIIKGNANEIVALSGIRMTTKGVDATLQSEFAIEAAQFISEETQATVVISGKVDWVVNHATTQAIQGGASLMSKLTGAGCLLTAIIAAFHAIEKNSFEASCLALTFYGACAYRAACESEGPASFKVKLIDYLSHNHEEIYA
jgi:hydroxyethylthiazole kinase